MKVSDLQRHLNDLGEMLRAAGVAKQLPDDLAAICEGLAPFRDLPLKGFADFLLRAEAFSGGEVPITPSKAGGRKGGGKGTPKPPAMDVQAIAADVKALYERAADPSGVRRPDPGNCWRNRRVQGRKSNHGGNRGWVYRAIETKVADIKRAIIRRIEARRGSFQRAGMIHRPEPASAVE